MYTLWVWRLTADLKGGDVAFATIAFLVSTGTGSCILGGRFHSVHAALVLFGTLYACMLLATRGHPAAMLDFRGTPFVGTLNQTYRHQLVFLALLLPAAVAIILFAHHL